MNDTVFHGSRDMLRWAREEAGLSHEALAEKLGFTAAGVAYAEEDSRCLSVANAVRWAEACGFGLGALYMSEPPEPESQLTLVDAIEEVLDWALQAMEEERLRYGDDRFERRYGNRPDNAVDITTRFLDSVREQAARSGVTCWSEGGVSICVSAEVTP